MPHAPAMLPTQATQLAKLQVTNSKADLDWVSAPDIHIPPLPPVC